MPEGDSATPQGPDPKGPWIMRYPYAVRILCAALDTALHLERVPHPQLDSNELALIRIRLGDEQHEVLVDNEYGDANSGHRALLLVQVLQALRFVEEEPGFDDWVREFWVQDLAGGFGEELRALHAQLGPAARGLLPRYVGLDVPGDYEWNVNSDGAQALRRVAAGEMD